MNNASNLTVEFDVHLTTSRRGRKRAVAGKRPAELDVPSGRTPRISKLMALAIRFEQLVRDGEVEDYADLARLGQVTRARMTQIMNLLNLAPDIQEALLFLPPVFRGRDPISERDVRPIAALPDWRKQRRMWLEAAGPHA